MKIDSTVKKETQSIALGVICLSLIMEAVYLVIGYWHISVLIANIVGAGVAVLNFLLMGLSIQRSLDEEVSDAKRRMQISQKMRTLMIFVVICAAASFTVFGLIPDRYTTAYVIALLLPLLFNRIVILVKTIMMNKSK